MATAAQSIENGNGRDTRNLMLGGTTTEEKKNPSHLLEHTVTPPERGASAVEERSPIVALRENVVYIGLGVSVVLFTGLALLTARRRDLAQPEYWLPLAALGVAVIVLALLPWRRLLTGTGGDAAIAAWMGAIVAGLLRAESFNGDLPLLAAYAGVVVFASAALVEPIWVAICAALAAGGYLLALSDEPGDLTVAAVAVRLGVLLVIGLLSFASSLGVRRYLAKTAAQLDELRERERSLQRREADLAQLYSVSRTMGAGSTLAEVLPELLHVVAEVLQSKVGIAILYDGINSLEVASPIWVSGHALRVDGYLMPLTERSIAQEVFITGEGTTVNEAPIVRADPLLGDLGARSAAATPLLVEQTPVGVLVVADREDGDYSLRDLLQLESLAGPAALIVNHFARYQEAKETGERMAELARMKTDFVSVVSHELRTPLTSILGSLATLRRPQFEPEDPNAKNLLATAVKQAERLKTLIEDLLVVSRIDNRALPLRPEVLELDIYLRELVNSTPGGDTISLDVAVDATSIEADPEHLRRVVTNLIENALKYAPHSPVELTAYPHGAEVRISVVDHGPGIPYELHEHIFGRFTQVARAETRGAGGTGLGLSIVRGLTEAMGGRVWFEPTIGGGATFTVAFPRAAGILSRS